MPCSFYTREGVPGQVIWAQSVSVVHAVPHCPRVPISDRPLTKQMSEPLRQKSLNSVCCRLSPMSANRVTHSDL